MSQEMSKLSYVNTLKAVLDGMHQCLAMQQLSSFAKQLSFREIIIKAKPLAPGISK